MKKNLPVHDIEVPFTSGLIVTQTDLKGSITYANDSFVQLSGFSREELLGQNHNIVRHPDMPPVLFEDLWQTVKRGDCWRGLVKNRCKNGHYYWVDAFVVPVKERGTIRGYMSVRSPARPEAVREAKLLYPQLMQGKPLPRAKTPGRTLAWFRRAHVVLNTALLLGAGVLTGGVAGGAIIGAGALSTLGWLLAEKHRREHQQHLLDSCMNISEGRLTNELAINRAGEQGKLETALAYMQVHLKVMLDELQMTARAQAEETMHMQQRIAELFNRMAAGNESVSQISSAVEELSASIEQVAGHAEETARLSIDTSSSVAQSNADMNTSQQRTLAASQSVEQAQHIITDLASAIDSITQVTQTIHDIADQTNLLALNAAIEAARAGESGRGFAVVADEVRKLAERTSLSTDQIKQLIHNVREAANSTVSAIATITEQTRAGAEAQLRTTAKLQGVQDSSHSVNQMMQAIAGTNAQQSAAAAHLAERMAHIAEQFAESHQHIRSANHGIEKLADQAARVSALAAHFEVEADTQPA
ncbi:PAS domain-containing methyl-accepting chemotaxis protein [Vogesella sp. LYT5W]|uniref:PAS domain-containing methyl-accepting chemotaxis protein n=1 Tax=Vogesella margarita TaxID=2984199 RepID=A0ABT5IMU6_9NEIS|nr:PAS domain-containing methyl-accepting chemotaxis protein [Vogesella margarita]MDC7713891.1 PAS domain-containing methyl-accepting chemotaxis protein [Vogesella margarita]